MPRPPSANLYTYLSITGGPRYVRTRSALAASPPASAGTQGPDRVQRRRGAGLGIHDRSQPQAPSPQFPDLRDWIDPFGLIDLRPKLDFHPIVRGS